VVHALLGSSRKLLRRGTFALSVLQALSAPLVRYLVPHALLELQALQVPLAVLHAPRGSSLLLLASYVSLAVQESSVTALRAQRHALCALVARLASPLEL